MSAKRRRYLIAFGVAFAVTLVLTGVVYAYMRPYLPDKISFRDGHVTLFYIGPYRGDR